MHFSFMRFTPPQKETKKEGQKVCVLRLKRKSFHFQEEGSYVCLTWGFKGFGDSSESVQKLQLLLLLASIFCWMHQMLLILLQCLSLGTASNCGFAKSPLPFLNTNG
jgi:hypothetical protein